MNYPKRIVLVRHGQSEGNVISADDLSWERKANHQFALTEKGKEQCLATGSKLRKRFGEFDAYFHSSFARTKESLRHLFPEAEGTEDCRLDEWWRGIWHSLSNSKARTSYPAEWDIFEREGRYHYRAPGGESGQDVELRIRSFIHDLRIDWSGKSILISGHGNWIILFGKVLQGISVEEAMRRCRDHVAKNASVTVYEFDEKSKRMLLVLEHSLLI